MSLAAVVGILLNLLLPNEKENNDTQNFSKENETVKKADLDKNNLIELNHPLIEHKLGMN